MNIKTLFQRFQNTLAPQQKLDNEVVFKFLKVLEKAREDELSCNEMFVRLEEFVETEVESKDAGKISPLIREHLDMCTDCCEEYEALLTVLENTKEG